MNKVLNKLAAVLAFIIGGMAVFSGGKVLLGNDPGYYVIAWLPVYNYTIGILTVFITATLIWSHHRLAVTAAVITFSAHTLVMLILQAGYGGVVATESIRAMTIRIIAWTLILALMLLGRSRVKSGEKVELPAGS